MTCCRIVLLLVLTDAVFGLLPLQDATATVNHLFVYKIDKDDFPNQQIKVTETEQETLPSWLDFDSTNNYLTGVPTVKDKGTYILSVGSEMFAVSVKESGKSQIAQPANNNEQTICNPHDSITVAYVKLNVDVESMSALKRAQLVHRLSDHLSLKPEHISMSAQPADLVDSNRALVYGSGDVQANDGLSSLSWVVGCGAVKSHHMDILELLESTAKDGTMSEKLQTGVSGWQVQSNQPKVVSKRRLKRQLVTATPTPPTSSVGEDSTTTTTTSKTTVTPTVVVEERTTTTQPANLKPEVQPEDIEIFANGGELAKYPIPDDLFTDPEGEQLTYRVTSESGSGTWTIIENREIVGLAHKDDENSREVLKLIATDPQGLNEQKDIIVNHGAYRKDSLTKLYTLQLSANRAIRQPASIVYLAMTLQSLTSIENILVVNYDFTAMATYEVTFGDYNQQYVGTCPKSQHTRTLEELRGMVGNQLPLIGSKLPKSPFVKDLTSVESVLPCTDAVPVVNSNKIAAYNPLTVYLGELYETVLPADLFTDEEDGDLSNMAIKLLVDGKVESNGWISLDSPRRQLQALTWDTPDTQSQFTFAVMDTGENEVEEPIEVRVVDNSDDMPSNNLISLTIEKDYSTFANNHQTQINLYKKINAAFPGTTLTVKSVKTGSIIFQYSLRASESSSTPQKQCSRSELNSYKKVLFDGEYINPSFIESLDSYPLEKVDFAAVGMCEGVVESKSATRKPPAVPASPEPKPSLIIPIIIAIVAVFVLIIIIIIVVVCIRKRKAAKAQAGRQNGKDIEKRVPVVMDEEMKSLNRADDEPLMASADVGYKPTPPAYPGDEDYMPDTPPVSEPDDEQRILDRSP